jgi:hypothetical protein
MIIRDIIIDDFEEVIDLMQTYHRETNLRKFPFSREHVERTLTRGVGDPRVLQRIAVKDNEVLGGISGSLIEFPFSADLYAADHLLYIKPSARYGGLKLVTTLVAAFKDWAFENGARQVRLGTIAGIKDKKFSKLAERCGFHYLGNIHSMEN